MASKLSVNIYDILCNIGYFNNGIIICLILDDKSSLQFSKHPSIFVFRNNREI